MPYIDKVGIAGSQYDIKDTTGTYIAPQEASPATADHAVGAYLVYNGALYQVSSAIAIGDTLTVGTNIEAVPNGIGGEVSELKSHTTIIAKSGKAIYHDETNITDMTVFGNPYAFNTIRFANEKNIFPSYPDKDEEKNGMSVSWRGRFFVMTGTATGSTMFRPNPQQFTIEAPEAGDYKIYIQKSGEFSATDNPYFYIEFISASGSVTKKTCYMRNGDNERNWAVALPAGVTKIGLSFTVSANTAATGDVVFWLGVYKSDVAFTDTGEMVAADGSAEISIDKTLFPAGIDSVQHDSIATYRPTIQEYIDNKAINIDESLTYTTPEAFGAIGDEQTDDSEAIMACIAYANESGKAVRAYQHYMVTSPINIEYSYMDIYINRITYNGSDAAVILWGRNNKIHVGYINSSGAGFRLIAGLSSDNKSSIYNNISFLYILSSDNAFECRNSANDPYAAGYYAIYNTIRFEHLQSIYGNGIYLQASYGEKSFFGGDIRVNTGWSIMTYESVNTFYNISMESTHGIYLRGMDNAGSTFIGGRNRELCDKYGTDQSDPYLGVLFKFDYYGHNNICIARDSIKAKCIDISERIGDVPNGFKGAVNMKIFGSNMSASGKHYSVDGQEILVLPHRVVLSGAQSREVIVSESLMDMRGYNTSYSLYTKFVAGGNATIYLNESYCSMGIKSFRIKQTNDYKLTIYDSLANVVFDGSALDAGEYEATAIFDTSTAGTVFNDGEHDSWEVIKLNIVS